MQAQVNATELGVLEIEGMVKALPGLELEFEPVFGAVAADKVREAGLDAVEDADEPLADASTLGQFVRERLLAFGRRVEFVCLRSSGPIEIPDDLFCETECARRNSIKSDSAFQPAPT